jgi:cellobiose epimerase
MKDIRFAAEARQLLEDNILPFWTERMADNVRGGYFGRMSGDGKLDTEAPRGAILNARILWSFAAAYRVLGNPAYLEQATRARDYLLEHFVDKEFGGVYWSVTADGTPLDTKKQTYAIGFAIYGLSEYARAAGDKASLEAAISLYRDLERHAFDPQNGGYHEALTREWTPMGDMRLSDKDENCDKTMNTHLHIIEPYTNLYRVWRTAELRKQIVGLVDVFCNRLLNQHTHHLELFFDTAWNGRRNIESFGHDIEASWLLAETADVLDDAALSKMLAPVIADIAHAAEEGINADGSMNTERWKDEERTTTERDWWVQCECVIGEINMAQRSHGDESDGHFKRARHCYDYIANNLVDNALGEWYWGVSAEGKPNRRDDHAGFWKCPYHNTRMCLEIIERLG